MERIKKYKNIIKEILEEIDRQEIKSSTTIKNQLIFDDNTGNYIFMMNDWRGESRLYGNLIHLEVTNEGKVWLYDDRTDLEIAEKLLQKGIPKSSILLGVHAPVMRKDTSFAVA